MPMFEIFDKIHLPYVFSEGELKIISENYRSAKDWKNNTLDRVKNDLKQYLRYAQNNECCYCRQNLGFDYRQVDLEHIVDKNDHWIFGFEPKNLALCCPACNSCKTDQESLVDKSVTEYPSSGDGFVIVHPYYDNYCDHIEIRYPVYISKSDKGDKTIEYCKLDRLKEAENRQKETMLKLKLVNALLQGPFNGKEKEIFMAIKEIITINQ